MIADHIDNSFYRLTAAQALELTFKGRLPCHGWASRADPAKLQQLMLRYYGHEELCTSKEGWIQQTWLSWHRGAAVPEGWVWAVHVQWATVTPPDSLHLLEAGVP